MKQSIFKYFIAISFFALFFLTEVSTKEDKEFLTKKEAIAKKDEDEDEEEEGVRITELNSPTVGKWSGEQSDIVLIDNICVFASDGQYRVRAEGSGAGKSFRVEEGKKKIDYLVYWNPEAYRTSEKIELFRNKSSRIFTTSETTSNDCNGGNILTAQLELAFPLEKLMKSVPGSYFGTLTITIESI
mgnify:CR=1 FL=1